ncbi:hypothetical protein KSS87_019427 [Heliosperma pusillum]|nr:hypothetical protein KSS87_019427 [Heliosperma pusillum]
MASSILIRRQLAPTSMAAKRAIHALASTILTTPTPTPTIAASASAAVSSSYSINKKLASQYRSPSRLSFTASYGSQAVAQYSDDDKSVSEEGLDISKLNIHDDVVSCLSKRGITKLFPIQKAVLEPAMKGRDMIGRAKTGTGKTLAFGIPILDKITRHNAKNGAGRDPLALVLAPTRELARQVDKEFYESSKLDTLCVYGGTPIARQMSVLSKGVDVVSGTPGRVIDLIKRGALDLSHVQFVVLDEADQMLNVGFAEDVEVILEKLPKNRQTMMFSATMPAWIVKLTRKYLKDPLTIDLVGDSDQKLAEGISLNSIVVDHHSKAGVIGPLFTEYANGGKCIVFTQTKRDADNLAQAMGRKNYKCEPLHGDIAQARGLDIPNVDLVIHYELPSTSEIFVHRSGRTGRAGKKGTAILIHTIDESRSARVIERDVGCRFQELPKIAPDGVELDMSRGFSGGGRFSSGGRSGNSGFSRGGYGGNSGFGGSGGSGGYGGSGSYGGSRSTGGGYSGSSQGGYGKSGFGRPSGGFGDFGGSDRSSNFGGGGRQGGFGGHSSSQSSGSFGGRSSNRFGSFGDDRS